jgi:ubiquinone/menaquinone biosynthesis C-methylase UbiE
MNYFDSQSSAERYAKGRPYFHSNTISRIKDFLKIENKLNKALDIACGTGLSTMALLPIAENVFGTDVSGEMLKMAAGTDKIIYNIAPAEDQPFFDNEFDLLTVSSGVHWFNIDEFLAEANRILKKDGFLVIYENAFPGKMENKSNFKQWNKEVYLERFPSPPRNKHYEWTPENLEPKKFILSYTDSFENAVHYNKNELVNYLLTQSNIIAAIENNQFTYPEIESWLKKELSAFFEDNEVKHLFYYNNWIKYLQKT